MRGDTDSKRWEGPSQLQPSAIWDVSRLRHGLLTGASASHCLQLLFYQRSRALVSLEERKEHRREDWARGSQHIMSLAYFRVNCDLLNLGRCGDEEEACQLPETERGTWRRVVCCFVFKAVFFPLEHDFFL